jgi:hypothetical protein
MELTDEEGRVIFTSKAPRRKAHRSRCASHGSSCSRSLSSPCTGLAASLSHTCAISSRRTFLPGHLSLALVGCTQSHAWYGRASAQLSPAHANAQVLAVAEVPDRTVSTIYHVGF